MKKGLGRTLALIGVAALLAAQSFAQPAVRGEKPTPRGQPAQVTIGKSGHDELPKPVVDEMAHYTAPGPQHKDLATLVGQWTTRTRVWESPDAKPLEFPGSAEYKTILGGRFLELESLSQMDGTEGRGLGIFGYDATKERYSFYFIHDGDTQALAGYGDRDSTEWAITFALAMDMPVSGQRAKPIRAVLRRLSPARHVFEMFEKYLDDREWKVLEIAYDRTR